MAFLAVSVTSVAMAPLAAMPVASAHNKEEVTKGVEAVDTIRDLLVNNYGDQTMFNLAAGKKEIK